MSDRLVLYETKVQKAGKAWGSMLQQVEKGWEVIQLLDTNDRLNTRIVETRRPDVAFTAEMVALMRRPLPDPPPPTSDDRRDGPTNGVHGWYGDPTRLDFERYFDGEFWTIHIRDLRRWKQAERAADGISKEKEENVANITKTVHRANAEFHATGVLDGVPEPGSPSGWYEDWVRRKALVLRRQDALRRTIRRSVGGSGDSGSAVLVGYHDEDVESVVGVICPLGFVHIPPSFHYSHLGSGVGHASDDGVGNA